MIKFDDGYYYLDIDAVTDYVFDKNHVWFKNLKNWTHLRTSWQHDRVCLRFRTWNLKLIDRKIWKSNKSWN